MLLEVAIVLTCMLRQNQGENHFHQTVIPDEQRVFEKIHRAGYEPAARPLHNRSETLIVEMLISLQQIVAFNEKTQTLTTRLSLEQTWHDQLLLWNGTDFNRVRSLRIPMGGIWTPDTFVFNTVDENHSGFLGGHSVLLRSSGSVRWLSPVQLKTACRVDISLFPFDSQLCEIRLGSWIYPSQWMLYSIKNEIFNQSVKAKELIACIPRDIILENASFGESSDWILKAVDLKYSPRLINKPALYMRSHRAASLPEATVLFGSNGSQVDIVLRLHIKRRSFFYVWNIVVPCLMLSLLTLVVFWTPVNSGEKITLGLSVFLSFSMFMMLIAERVPPTATQIPLIGVYMTTVMTLTASSVVVCVVVINLDCRGDMLLRAPVCLRRLLCSRLATWLIKPKQQQQQLRQAVASQSELSERIQTYLRSREKKIDHLKVFQSQLLELQKSLTMNCFTLNEAMQVLRLTQRGLMQPKISHSANVLRSDTPTSPECGPGSVEINQLRMKSPSPGDQNELATGGSSFRRGVQLPQLADRLNLHYRRVQKEADSLDCLKTETNGRIIGHGREELIAHQTIIRFEWKLLAQLMDRFLFIIFVVTTITCHLSLFIWPVFSTVEHRNMYRLCD